ncbi:MAG: rod shape-determining protein MreD, partial [Lysobacteraceae bacterium]
LLKDLDKLLSEETGLSVHVADDPLTCVARGGGRALELVYWSLEAPGRGGLATAWAAGLLADVVGGTLLGEQALRMAVLVFLVQRFRAQLRFFPLWQQSAAVGLLLINDLVLMLLIRAIAGAGWPTPGVVLAPLAGLLAWPWGFLLLDALRLRHRERVGGR